MILLRIFVLTLVFALTRLASAYADGHPNIAAIAIGNATVDAQHSALLNISFASAGQLIAGIQLDLLYEKQSMVFTVIPGPGVGDSGKRIWTSDPIPSVKRILIVGVNQNTIPDGVIATLSVQLGPDSPPGLHPLIPINPIATDPSGNGQMVFASVGGVVAPGTGPFSPLVSSVTNAASLADGPVAPGEIVLIAGESLSAPGGHPGQNGDGWLSTAIDGTRAFFDGVPAQLLYVTPDRVSAIVPNTVAGLPVTSLRLERQGVPAPPFILAVSRTAPGVFTVDQSGAGQAAIVNEDGTLNGPDNPATRGSVVSIYGTGQGQTLPADVERPSNIRPTMLQPVLPINLYIAGLQAELLYAGSAPGQVPGLLQMNARVPDSVTPGPAVPIVFTTETSSQAGVTLAIR